VSLEFRSREILGEESVKLKTSSLVFWRENLIAAPISPAFRKKQNNPVATTMCRRY
jgi:hypothetical protein